MNTLFRLVSMVLLLCAATTFATAQCTTWVDSPKKEAAENAHVSYRNFVKNKTEADIAALSQSEFDAAFKNWKIAYDIAPAADGKRASHFRDGRTFYKTMANKATDDAKKKEYGDRLIELYDEEITCYPDGTAFLLGRKGYDMFYVNGYSMEAVDVLEKAIDEGGEKTEYIVLPPLGQLLGYFYENDQLDAARVRELYEKGAALADANIAAGGDYASYYEDAKANLKAGIAKFKTEIFDCEYFKEDLEMEFKDNMDDFDALRRVVAKAKLQGCDENDAFVVKAQARVDELFQTKKAEYEQEQRENSPAYAARQLEEAGDYAGAIKAYEDALEKAGDDKAKARYYFQIAQIQYAELRQYGSARSNANKAAQLRSGWGQPYILIGDMYSRMSRNCGDAYEQRLAVLAAIDKYQYARSVDSEVGSKAGGRISRLSGSKPLKADAFSRGHKAGQKITVGCGINETVTLSF